MDLSKHTHVNIATNRSVILPIELPRNVEHQSNYYLGVRCLPGRSSSVLPIGARPGGSNPSCKAVLAASFGRPVKEYPPKPLTWGGPDKQGKGVGNRRFERSLLPPKDAKAQQKAADASACSAAQRTWWLLVCARPSMGSATHQHAYSLRITHSKWAHLRRPNVDPKDRRNNKPEWPMVGRATNVAPTCNRHAEPRHTDATAIVHCAHATPDP
jgi:hypothetical protein